MPWNSIAYVTSGLTLVAFIVAVGAWLYRNSLLHKKELIEQVPESERRELIQNLSESFNLNTAGLSRDQIYNLARERLKNSAEKFRITALVVTFFGILAAGVSILALSTSPEPDNKNSNKTPTPTPTSSLNITPPNSLNHTPTNVPPSNERIEMIKVILTTIEDKNEGDTGRIAIRNNATGKLLAEKPIGSEQWESGTTMNFEMNLQPAPPLNQCNQLVMEIRKKETYHKWEASLQIQAKMSNGQIIPIIPLNGTFSLKERSAQINNGLTCQQ